MTTAVAAGTYNALMEGFEQHPAYRHLSAEARQGLQQAAIGGRYSDAVKIALDAALAAAPQEVARQAEEEAMKKTKLIEKFEALNQALGRNGKRTATGGGRAPEPKNDSAKLQDPNTPIEEVMQIRARQRAE